MDNGSNRQHSKQPPGILARWYATPLDQPQAEALLQQAAQRRSRAITQSPERGAISRTAILMEAIANFWLTGEIAAQLKSPSSPLQRSMHGRILAQTIRGQLLISRQLAGGLEDLKQSFKLAAPLLKADDYFLLMERYKSFEALPQTEKPQAGITENELLNVGGVIRKLSKGVTTKIKHDPTDLYG
ncbi:MAG TPA: hypothetical protein ENH92_00065 [Ectothiorhodospiraceae bacterium]|nr:hypothetical protein [Ectothiorhodospiraceae bacterium]